MDYREIIVTAGKKLIHEGFTIETWGNISVRDENGLVYITPSGMDYETCTVDDVVVMTSEKKNRFRRAPAFNRNGPAPRGLRGAAAGERHRAHAPAELYDLCLYGHKYSSALG